MISLDKMDATQVWRILVVVRLLSVFVPQSGYLHPDEFFQTTEVVAGDILDVQHHRTWEFTWENPIRSILLPYAAYGPVLFLLRLLNLATPCLVLVLPRLVISIAGIIVDSCTFDLCRKYNNNGYTSMLLYSTSYVAWTYMTHTFSNSIETILFAVLLAVTSGACPIMCKQRRGGQSSSRETALIAAILTVGMFNRPTFLIFAFVPVTHWLWNSVISERRFSDRINFVVNQLSVMSIVCVLISVVFVVVDTIYFRYESVRHIPKDIENCVVSDKKIECLRKMYTTYKPSIVISPYNFLAYNSQSSNLSRHGNHPFYFHTLVSLPLLFGPMVIFVLWRILKNVLNVMLGGSLKVNSDFHLDDVYIVSCFSFPLVVFSCISHQEPRFLLPLFPLGVVIATKTMASFKMKKLIFMKFCVVNLLGLLVFGFLHQGGIVPGISQLQKKIASNKGDSHVVFYHTYMPPEHLFLHPEDSESKLYIYDLGGASFEKLEKKMESIRTIAADKPQDERSGIWVVAPKTVVADVRKLSVKYGTVDKYWHLSMEDPPRMVEWFKRELSFTEIVGDFSLVVAEVKSWKLFKDGGQTKKKSSR
ncbi:GPI mannosyltransferase 4-like [Haliotis cracherodii]|uniref:GPI mannosyltransferase 4-like n=1 Tax=Haliotis cracherodii TaxID=6455 RepID=UPI0039EB7FF9